jgi:hypothetical protein
MLCTPTALTSIILPAKQMIKDQMDKKFGSPWHVIVGKGFAYEITYEVSSSCSGGALLVPQQQGACHTRASSRCRLHATAPHPACASQPVNNAVAALPVNPRHCNMLQPMQCYTAPAGHPSPAYHVLLHGAGQPCDSSSYIPFTSTVL